MVSAAAAVIQQYSSGSSSFRITLSSRLAKNTVATCRVPAVMAPPLAAAAADSVGSNALANTSSSSMVSTPSPIICCRSPAAVSVMARAPAMGTNRGTDGCSAAVKKLSATPHSSTTPSSSAAPDAFSRSAAPRYCRASSHSRDRPSVHAVWSAHSSRPSSREAVSGGRASVTLSGTAAASVGTTNSHSSTAAASHTFTPLIAAPSACPTPPETAAATPEWP